MVYFPSKALLFQKLKFCSSFWAYGRNRYNAIWCTNLEALPAISPAALTTNLTKRVAQHVRNIAFYSVEKTLHLPTDCPVEDRTVINKTHHYGYGYELVTQNFELFTLAYFQMFYPEVASQSPLQTKKEARKDVITFQWQKVSWYANRLSLALRWRLRLM